MSTLTELKAAYKATLYPETDKLEVGKYLIVHDWEEFKHALCEINDSENPRCILIGPYAIIEKHIDESCEEMNSFDGFCRTECQKSKMRLNILFWTSTKFKPHVALILPRKAETHLKLINDKETFNCIKGKWYLIDFRFD